MTDKLIVFQKMYDFIRSIYPLIDRFPKTHVQIIGKQIEEMCIYTLLLITKANKCRDSQRSLIQTDIFDNLDFIVILIRLSKDLRYISVKQYLVVSNDLNEISKLLYCWSKS